jgi:hypothetical protein
MPLLMFQLGAGQKRGGRYSRKHSGREAESGASGVEVRLQDVQSTRYSKPSRKIL